MEVVSAAHAHGFALACDQVFYFSNSSIILPGLQASIGVTCSYSSRPFLCTLGLTHVNVNGEALQLHTVYKKPYISHARICIRYKDQLSGLDCLKNAKTGSVYHMSDVSVWFERAWGLLL